MERPILSTNEVEAAKFDEIASRVKDQFGDEALFLYKREGKTYLLTVDEAMIISGEHIAPLELHIILDIFSGMYAEAQQFRQLTEKRPDMDVLYQKSRHNTRQALARYAVRESSEEG